MAFPTLRLPTRTTPTATQLADRVFVIGMALCMIGLLMVMSASAFLQTAGEGVAEGNPYRLAARQGLCLLIAIAAYIGVRRMRLAAIDRFARPALVGVGVLLVLVLVPGIGSVEGNASRWLRLGPLSFQPSEVAKLALIVFLAHWLARERDVLRSFKEGVLPTVGIIALVCGLIALEPDLGTSVLLASVSFAMLIVAGMHVRHLLPFAIVGLPAFIAVMALRFEHIVPRFRAFLDPMAHYQTKQSLLALGSGGVFGLGLGQGRQKLAYLPQVHGDFLFASIGEELGLIGTFAVLGLFGLLIWTAVRMLMKVRDPFAFFVGTGVTTLIGLQAAINIAVVTASAPPKGIALPFISQGGTSLIVMVTGLALLVNAGQRADEARARAAGTATRARPAHPHGRAAIERVAHGTS